jgi:hypothetical protein
MTFSPLTIASKWRMDVTPLWREIFEPLHRCDSSPSRRVLPPPRPRPCGHLFSHLLRHLDEFARDLEEFGNESLGPFWCRLGPGDCGPYWPPSALLISEDARLESLGAVCSGGRHTD